MYLVSLELDVNEGTVKTKKYLNTRIAFQMLCAYIFIKMSTKELWRHKKLKHIALQMLCADILVSLEKIPMLRTQNSVDTCIQLKIVKHIALYVSCADGLLCAILYSTGLSKL